MEYLSKRIVVLPGDGIGPEVTSEAVRVLKAVAERFGHHFAFDYRLVGASAIDATGHPLPDATLEACLRADAVLLGAVARPEQNLPGLRESLGLYANIRPITAYEQLVALSPLQPERIAGTDLLIFRELHGGPIGESEPTPDAIARIAHRAFRAAQARRRKLTLVSQAEAHEPSRLWREVVHGIAAEYEDVTLNYLYVGDAAMQLVLNPRQFDVILTEGAFGGVISDQASAVAGSLGLLPSASVGDGPALFEPLHGPCPPAKGKGTANPIAAILSAAMMLDHFGLPEEARAVRAAVENALSEQVLTPELSSGASYTTEQVGSFIAYGVLDLMDCYLHRSNIAYGRSTII